VKRISVLVMAVLVMAWSAAAQTATQAQSQTNAGASSSTNVSADKNGVKAQNETCASASQQTDAQSSREKQGKSKAKASGSANADSSQSASMGAGEMSLATGSTLNAVLTKSVDSKKAKEGDEVTAKTTSTTKAVGQRTIPKGTKLIGHITKANARAKGDSESALGILFDRAEVAKGREVPIHAVVQALAVNTANASMAASDEPMGSMQPSGGATGGGTNGGNSGGGLVGGTVAGAARTVDNTANAGANVAGSAVGSASGTVNRAGSGVGTTAGSTLSASSQGVVGLPGYTLDAAATNATQGSVITSTGKNVKLDSGTQMVLRVVSE